MAPYRLVHPIDGLGADGLLISVGFGLELAAQHQQPVAIFPTEHFGHDQFQGRKAQLKLVHLEIMAASG